MTTFVGLFTNDDNGEKSKVGGTIEFTVDPVTRSVQRARGLIQLHFGEEKSTHVGSLLRRSEAREDTGLDLILLPGRVQGTREMPLSLCGSGFELEVEKADTDENLHIPLRMSIDIEVLCVQPGEWALLKWRSHEILS
ncbi:hypothetical protein [Singulisphaera sp. PoT]|uniref:hypothetical protein n=1 Tax=Singulisphaera sp. PoT TaxID=3411797 RepID=UPI003BF5329D